MQPCGFRTFTWTWHTTFKWIKHKTDREIDTSATSVLWVPYCATSKGTKYWRSLAVAIKEHSTYPTFKARLVVLVFIKLLFIVVSVVCFVYCKVLFNLSRNCEWMWHVSILYFLIFMPISMRKVKRKKEGKTSCLYTHKRFFVKADSKFFQL